MMKAIQFDDSIPRYAVTRGLGMVRHGVYWGGLACLQLREVEPPALPGPDWLRIATRYGGICGSDLGTITLKASTSTSVFTSFPFTLGHENVGTIAATGDRRFAVGERVVVNPLLSCAVRGFAEPCEMCCRGEVNLCQRFDKGAIAPGLLTGFCRDTGGSWSREFVAHESQVLRVPEGISDEEAVLSEPFAVALHAVLHNPPADGDDVLIIGGGIIGLCVVAALRAIGTRARVVISVRHRFQEEAAKRLGADVVLAPSGGTLDAQMLKLFGAESLKPVIGKRVVVGGANVVFECVGSGASISDALRYTASGGRVVLVGAASTPRGVDWTPIWLNELSVHGTFCYADEEWQGERISTMELALRLMADGKADLASLVTHRFQIDDYRHALETVTSKGSSGVIKGVFAFDGRDERAGARP